MMNLRSENSPTKMKKILLLSFYVWVNFIGFAQEQFPLHIYGELKTDQRVIVNDPSQWAWNENRVTLKVEKKGDNGKFYSEFWVRNFGIPNYATSNDLFNRGIVDPFDIQIREAYYQINNLFIKNLDLKIGRQRITWGTADKLNPTDNLNPSDMEDILDFGRHRGSDAINFTYYIKNDFSLQAVLIPLFQPANLPVGIFSNALMPSFDPPQNIKINAINTSFNKPNLSFKENSTLGFKFKGNLKSIDFSFSYVYGFDGIPYLTKTTVTPEIYPYGIKIDAELSYARNHIFGVDFASNIKGVGVWGELALFKLSDDLIYTSIVNPLIPISDPTVTDSIILTKEKPYFRSIIGADYHFGKGSYINIQYMHGFIHERGNEHMSDYLFLRYDQRLLDDKITLSPISGAFIITNWSKAKDNFCLIYSPQIAYNPTPDFQLALSTAIIYGKGDGVFTSLQDFDQIILKAIYSF